MKKARFDADGHYTKQEINDVVKLQEKGKLDKKNIRKMRKFILKDVRLANALESEKKWHQDLTNLLVENLKQAWRKDLIEHFKKFWVLKSNGEVKTDWQSQMKLVQIMLKYRYNKYHGEIDGKMWPWTFKALLNYQTENYKYRNLTLSAVNTFLSSKWKSTLPGKDSGFWKPDGIADGRTILSFFEDIVDNKEEKWDDMKWKEWVDPRALKEVWWKGNNKEEKWDDMKWKEWVDPRVLKEVWWKGNNKEEKWDDMKWKEWVDPRALKEVWKDNKDNSDISVPPFNPLPWLYPDVVQVPDTKEMINKQEKFKKQKELLWAIIWAFGNLYPNASEWTTIADLWAEFNKTNADNIVDQSKKIVKLMSSILDKNNEKFSSGFDKNITNMISKVTATEPKTMPSVNEWEKLLKSNIVSKNTLELNTSKESKEQREELENKKEHIKAFIKIVEKYVSENKNIFKQWDLGKNYLNKMLEEATSENIGTIYDNILSEIENYFEQNGRYINIDFIRKREEVLDKKWWKKFDWEKFNNKLESYVKVLAKNVKVLKEDNSVNISDDSNNTNADDTIDVSDLNTSSIDKNSTEYNEAVKELENLIKDEEASQWKE